MSRKLKDFIDENRREFDDELPSPAAWESIEDRINTHRSASPFTLHNISRWSAAAAVFFIVAACLYFVVIRKTTDQETIVKKNSPVEQHNGSDIGKIAPEYAAEATRIFQSIEDRQEQLKLLTEKRPDLYNQFSQDLAALDSSYRVLKSKAVESPGREIIIRAMLQNLQLQAELLSKQLLILQELDNSKTQQHEKNTNRSI